MAETRPELLRLAPRRRDRAARAAGAAGVVAVVVYEVAGLRSLRTAWFNLDRLWAGC
ncbi:hypothetical protein [Catenuloplanes indicus]|uniref:Uncharacterized protein n=1 Tax=Catenuloplanes indicus TaxID=137267 RepID=A0AAE4B316_9ACTN|nr:hypothetical protein [Catenuloplanes indicus]MDQ0369633.1 hypothetical protein [Catenuloplanes indicus]